MRKHRTILIALLLIIVALAIAFGLFVRSCNVSMESHDHYHRCEWHRMALNQAKYWYALDNGRTSGAPVVAEALTPYFADGKLPVCPGGGPYELNPVGHYIVCSVPEHMLESCKGGEAVSLSPEDYAQEYPLDYHNSQHWWYSMDSHQRGALVRMSGCQLLIEGLHGWGGSAGTVQVAGSGSGSGSSSSGDRTVRTSYSGGIYTMEFAGHKLKITDSGRTLELDGQTFDLSDERKTLIVQTNGIIRTGSLKE